MKTISILGATGSIGASTLAVVRQHPDKFQVHTLIAQSNWQKLAELAKEFRAQHAVIGDDTHYQSLQAALSDTSIQVHAGEQAIIDAAADKVDQLMLAIVGIAGLKPAFAAAKAGQTILLANKESLVCGGDILLSEVQENSAKIIPVDSEHNAIYQIYNAQQPNTVASVTLTASGGPFRTWNKRDIENATPDQAVAHPNWSMGAKISVDSATLMNKGLELIEAAYLFPAAKQKLDVLVHPQSIIHGLVTYIDGTTKAVMGPPDMQSPIAVAMAEQERLSLNLPQLNLAEIKSLTFEKPNTDKFPCLKLAQNALQKGQAACIALNAANEIAVADFLSQKISFPAIAQKAEQALETNQNEPVKSAGDIFTLDKKVKKECAA